MPQVAVVMGSTSDWSSMKKTTEILDILGVTYEKHVISAHRMPQELQAFGTQARDNKIQVIIAGAGGTLICLVCWQLIQRYQSSACRCNHGH